MQILSNEIKRLLEPNPFCCDGQQHSHSEQLPDKVPPALLLLLLLLPVFLGVPEVTAAARSQQAPAQDSSAQLYAALLNKAQDSRRQPSTRQHPAQRSTAQPNTPHNRPAQHSSKQHTTGQHSTAEHTTQQASTTQLKTPHNRPAQHSRTHHTTGQHSHVLYHSYRSLQRGWCEGGGCARVVCVLPLCDRLLLRISACVVCAAPIGVIGYSYA
jgi:hypothetical protein